MEPNDKVIEIIRQFEPFRSVAARDAYGIVRVGWGTYVGVREGQRVTEEEALELLRADVERFADAARRLFWVPLTQGQFDALVSLLQSAGEAAVFRSLLRTNLNKKRPDLAARAFMRLTKIKGVEVPELVARRKVEMELFLS